MLAHSFAVAAILFFAFSSTAHTAEFIFVPDWGDNSSSLRSFVINSADSQSLSKQFDAPYTDDQQVSDVMTAGYGSICRKSVLREVQTSCEAKKFNAVYIRADVFYKSNEFGGRRTATATCNLEFNCLNLGNLDHIHKLLADAGALKVPKKKK